MEIHEIESGGAASWRIGRGGARGSDRLLAAAMWRDYVSLIRFPYHVTFAGVALGALLVTGEVTPALARSLLLLYVSFNVFLYGGIYTINAIADLESDGRHPTKRARPLPSRRVGVGSAAVFSSVMLAAGLAGGFLLFSRSVFGVFVAVLALNVFYTFVAKHVPYLELAANGVTHPLRFLMGVFLANGDPPYLLLLAVFFLALGLAGVRRSVEKDVRGWRARKTLERYSGAALDRVRVFAFLAVLPLWAADTGTSSRFIAVVLAAYVVLVFGVDLSASMRRLYVAIWTR